VRLIGILLLTIPLISIGLSVRMMASPGFGPSRAVQVHAFGQPVDHIQCSFVGGSLAFFALYFSVSLDGKSHVGPGGIGIDMEKQCFYWVHTHAADGVVHVLAPAGAKMTLGTFFDIWRASSGLVDDTLLRDIDHIAPALILVNGRVYGARYVRYPCVRTQ
jgi:hypothetical protein